MKQKDKTSKKRYDQNKGWYSSLKEIGYLLPIAGTASGRGLTKKETLIHMLQYFDFLQNHIQSLQSRLPPHCLPQVNDRESESESEDTPQSEPTTPPHVLKLKSQYNCTYLCKRTTLSPDSDCNTQPGSSDSTHSLSSLLPEASFSRTGSAEDQESPYLGSNCSVCADRTGSEDGSQGSKNLDTPPSQSFLLKELHLSPSLLTSPSRGLRHPLLPNAEEELQSASSSVSTAVFEDVWVTPKPPFLKACSLPCNSPDDLHFSSGCVSSPSEEDDVNWTPKRRRSMKAVSKAHCKRFFSKSQDVTNSGLKKKCVNGFIMFCCMNRRLYCRAHPGTPSTVVTKELASLWHIMPKTERRLYCLKARRFSRQQNRNVRSEEKDVESEAEICIPSPLHMLLAHRNLYFTSNGKT